MTCCESALHLNASYLRRAAVIGFVCLIASGGAFG